MNNTLVKGLRVLEILARNPDAIGVTEIGTRAGLFKSDVHRLVQTLVELGFARQDPASGAYFATVRLWELGWAVMDKQDIRKVAEPFMGRLMEQTRETVHLSVLDVHDAVYIHKLDSPEPVRAYSDVGGRAPAAAVATGKALLARLPESEQREAARNLRRYTPRTIVEPEEFIRELARIRMQGYAVNRGEWRESVCGIAAHIPGPEGVPVAAVGISGPAERIKPSRFRELGSLVMQAAASISDGLAAGMASTPARRRKLA